jgi:hypothetical protein
LPTALVRLAQTINPALVAPNAECRAIPEKDWTIPTPHPPAYGEAD